LETVTALGPNYGFIGMVYNAENGEIEFSGPIDHLIKTAASFYTHEEETLGNLAKFVTLFFAGIIEYLG